MSGDRGRSFTVRVDKIAELDTADAAALPPYRAAIDQAASWVGISWTDEAAILECHRPECMVDGKWLYQEELPYLCTPEQAVGQANAHRATHHDSRAE